MSTLQETKLDNYKTEYVYIHMCVRVSLCVSEREGGRKREGGMYVILEIRCVSSNLGSNQTLGTKAEWEQHKDGMCGFGWLVGFVLCHINFYRLFNVMSRLYQNIWYLSEQFIGNYLKWSRDHFFSFQALLYKSDNTI